MNRFSIFILFFSMICLANFAWSNENEWTTNGPYGGTVKTIEINQHNRNTIYIGTITNGMYQTVDAGEHWSHIDNDGLFMTMRDISIHPLSPDTVFIATVSGLFKSTNSCSTWSFIAGSNSEFEVIKYHPQNPHLLFAGGPTRTWKSLDGGNTWVGLDVPSSTGMIDICFNPQNPNSVYFIGTSMVTERGVWKSSDMGETWENIQNNIIPYGSGTHIEIDPVDTNNIYISVDNYTMQDYPCIYKSTDGGNNWLDISPEFLYVPYVLSIVVSPNNNEVLYAATFDNGVIMSEDSGDSWSEINDGLSDHHVAAIEIDPVLQVIYIGTIYDGFYKKTIANSRWDKFSNDINIAHCFHIDVSAENSAKAFVAAANGVFFTENSGELWSCIEIDVQEGNQLWDGIFDVYLPQRYYACSGLSTISQVSLSPKGFYRSDDAGVSWEFYNDGLPEYLSYNLITVSYNYPDSRRIFMTSTAGLYKSDDDGESWELCDNGIPTNDYFEDIEISPSNQQVIGLAYYPGNKLFISYDRGDSWVESGQLPQAADAHTIELAFNPLNSSHIYISIARLGIYESLDSGQTWQSLVNDLPLDGHFNYVSGITINPYNPDNIFVSTFGHGIYQSHNGGLHWESFNAGMDTTGVFNEMMFAPGDTTILYLARGNRSVWSINRTPVGIENEEVTLPTQYSLSAYPNPFNATTSISFTLIQPSQVTLDIYDILGRRAESLVDEFLPAGNHSVLWQAGEMPSGIYFYRID